MLRPPLRQVASAAGVSEPTVSRVLNGKRGVAPATRERVLRAIASLGYDESVARSRARTGVVGIITPELDNPIFPEFLHAIDSRLARHGFTVQVGVATTETVTEERHVEVLLEHDVDGIIFIAGRHADVTADIDLYQGLVAKGIPIVLVNGRETDLTVPHVLADEGQAAARAVAHLSGLGHERIGCVVGPRRFVPTERMIAGFESAMGEHGRATSAADVVETVFTVEGGHAGAVQLIEDGVTGVIAGNDLMALGVVRAASSFGLDVPKDLSVVGYDGTPLTAFTGPALTTFRQPVDEMGLLAADALASEIDGTRRFQGVFTFVPDLVARASTGPRL